MIKRNPHEELKNVIKKWVVNNVETTSVAVVVGVADYPIKRVVDVLPLPMERSTDGSVIVPDTVYNCPVILQGSQKGVMSFPLKVGDKVCIGYCKRSFYEFINSTSSAQYLPEDFDVFGANNAVVLGYVAQEGIDVELLADDFFIRFMDSSLTIKENNDIIVENNKAVIQALNTGDISATNDTCTISATNSGVITLDNGQISLTLSGTTATITASNIVLDGNVSITQDLDVNGATSLSSTVTSGGKDISGTHTHSGVTPGGGVSGPPV